jgi:hypothetical protein
MAKLKYNTGIPPISEYWTVVVCDALDRNGIPEITVSSTYRRPRAQAVAMYNNIVSYGAASQKALYSITGDKIVDLYVSMKAAGATKEEIISAMEKKVVDLKFLGAHGSIDPDYVAFDVPPASVTAEKRSAFEAAMKSIATKFLSPYVNKGEPVYHIELKKGMQKVLDTGMKMIPVLMFALTAYLIYKKLIGSLP